MSSVSYCVSNRLCLFRTFSKRMASLFVHAGVDPTPRPPSSQVLVVGQQKLLRAIDFDKRGLESKLAPLVNPAQWQAALAQLSPSGTVPLHLNVMKIVSVVDDASRNNSPANSVAITKSLRGTSPAIGMENLIVIVVVTYANALATVAAIARCFPLYDRKTKSTKSSASSSPLSTFQRIDLEVVITDQDKSLTAEDVALLQSLAESVRTTARLVDAPANELHTEAFVDEARALVATLGVPIETTLIKGDDLLAQGFGGVYHVGKAAVHPPIFACFSHKPPGASETFALVGKGIVYDTGGMQIKGKTAMPSMKVDMGGAAALLNAFCTLVRIGFKANLHCLLCVAENSISPYANKPDDVITMLSGKTVEINNTDAEGRLVLADGVFYAHTRLKANVIIDMATLTGAQAYVSGMEHAAILTNNEQWERDAINAGRASGDLVHPLPYCPDLHFPDLKSAVADMRNSNLGKMQGPPSAVAGLFIASHIDFTDDVVWLHVDMAGPAWTGERGTGFGPALITALLGRRHTDVPLLNLPQ